MSSVTIRTRHLTALRDHIKENEVELVCGGYGRDDNLPSTTFYLRT